jgi:DNA polymerase I-like protein with 3'-5' exonuclease and polymerase domains
MSLQIAKFILDSYHKAIPEIAVWWFNVQRQLATTRCLESPLGGRRLFFGRLDDDTFREAYSHSAQSTVADLMNRALHLCEETFNENDCRVVLQVHDELVLEVRADSTTAQHYIQRLRNIMEYPMRFSGIAEPLVIPADISIGVNWYDQVKPDVFFNTELAKV